MTTVLALMSPELLWRNALAAVPLAIAVAIVCRLARCRPSTRHSLWLIVLLSLLAPPLLPGLDFASQLPRPHLVSSDNTDERTTDIPINERAMVADSPHVSAPPKPAASITTNVQPGKNVAGSANSSIPEAHSPVPGSAVPTASDRSPSALRETASHPKSSSSPANRTPSPAKPLERPSNETDFESPAASSLAAPADWLSLLHQPNVGAMRAAQMPAGRSSNQKDQFAAHKPPVVGEWQSWLARLAEAREALVRLAPVPLSLWVAGAIVIMAIMFGRILRFRHVVRHARPAEPYVLEVVEQCAEVLDLRRLPRVVITRRAVSPLVWCWGRSMLVLPETLWRDLDDSGRRAVLVHELAHLKRRDHWVCWVQMVVCVVDWWNPMVWWLRHRLREEADLCCDSWVTAVLPQSRAAYARALVTTRQFLTAQSVRTEAPPMALGATSARTKRFARRLTMVMTERTAPRLSLTGTAAALMLAGAAWLATPLWACPPEDSESAAHAKAVAQKEAKAAKERTAKAPKAASQEKSAKAKAELEAALAAAHAQHGQHAEQHAEALAELHAAHAHASPDAAAGSTFERHMATREHGQAPRAQGGGGQSGDLEQRIDRLEDRLDRLTQHLEMLLGSGRAPTGGGATMNRAGTPQPPAPPSPPAAPRRPATAASPAAPAAPAAPSAPRAGALRRAPDAPAAGGGVNFAPAPDDIDTEGETIVKFYPLPADKAASLFEFMRRDDVPVLVAPREDGIEVHGTAQQHRIFAAFVKMVHPEAKIDAMMEPGRDAAGGRQILEQRRRELQARLDQARQQMERQRRETGQQLRQQMQQRQKEVEQQRRELEKQRSMQQREIEDLRRRSRDMEMKSEQLRDKSEGSAEQSARTEMIAQADALRAESHALEAQADTLEDQLDSHLEAIEDELEAALEAMENELEAQADAFEAEWDAHEDALEAEIEAQLEALEMELAAAERRRESLPPANLR